MCNSENSSSKQPWPGRNHKITSILGNWRKLRKTENCSCTKSRNWWFIWILFESFIFPTTRCSGKVKYIKMVMNCLLLIRNLGGGCHMLIGIFPSYMIKRKYVLWEAWVPIRYPGLVQQSFTVKYWEWYVTPSLFVLHVCFASGSKKRYCTSQLSHRNTEINLKLNTITVTE